MTKVFIELQLALLPEQSSRERVVNQRPWQRINVSSSAPLVLDNNSGRFPLTLTIVTRARRDTPFLRILAAAALSRDTTGNLWFKAGARSRISQHVRAFRNHLFW